MGNCPVSLPPPEPLLEDDKYKTVKTQQQQQQQERNESPRSVMLSLETNPNSSQQQNKNNNHDPTPFKWEPHRALLPRHSILDPDEVRGILMHQGMELAWRDEQTARQNMIGTNNLLDESLEDKDNARNHDPHDSNQYYNDDEDAHTELSTSTMALTDVTRKISNADRYSLRPALLSASSSSRRRLRLAPRQIGLTQKSPNAKQPNSNPQQPSPDSKLSGSSDSSMSQAAFQKSLLKLSSSTHTGNNTTVSAISVPGASRRLLSSFSACSGTTGAGTTTTTSTPTMASQSVSSHENGSNHAPNKGPVASKAGCQLIPAGFSSSTTTNATNHTPNTTTTTTTDHANHMTPHFHHHFYPIHWEHFVVLELAMKAHWVDYYQTHYKAAFPHDRFLLSNNSNSHNNHHSAKSPVQGMEEEEVMIRMGIDPQIPFLHLCMTGSLGLVERCRRTNHDLNSNMARMKDGRKDARHFLVLQHALSFKPICVCALKAKPQKQASGSSTLSAVDPQQQQQQPQPPRQDVIRMYATKPRSAGQRQAATTADLGLSQRENETSLPLYAWAELVVVNLESVTDVSNVQYKLHFFSKQGTCEERPTLWGRHTTSGSDHGASLAIDWIGRTDGETRDAGCGQISINDRHQFSVKVARGIDPAPLLCVAAIVDELVEYRLRRACKIKKMAQRLPPQTPTKKNNSR